MSDFRMSEVPSKPPRRWGRWLVLVVVTLVAYVGFGFPGYDWNPKTCAVCRLNRVDHSFLGIAWPVEKPTVCSRWYSANVEPSHVHAWARRGRCRTFGFFGLGGIMCSWGGPITQLDPDLQVAIYQHFDDRLEAKALFIRMMQRDADSQEMGFQLESWASEGYPGPWADWWPSHRSQFP